MPPPLCVTDDAASWFFCRALGGGPRETPERVGASCAGLASTDEAFLSVEETTTLRGARVGVLSAQIGDVEVGSDFRNITCSNPPPDPVGGARLILNMRVMTGVIELGTVFVMAVDGTCRFERVAVDCKHS